MALFFFLGEQVFARVNLPAYQGVFAFRTRYAKTDHFGGMDKDAIGEILQVDDEYVVVGFQYKTRSISIPVGFAQVLLQKTTYDDSVDIESVKDQYCAAYRQICKQGTTTQHIRNVFNAWTMLLEDAGVDTAEIRTKIEETAN